MSNASPPEHHEPKGPISRLEHATSIIIQGLIAPAIVLVVIGSFAILLWTLIAFAQTGNLDALDCVSRETGNGFIGNPDFYGFGIRLGIYCQWWASLIANLFLPNEWASMFGAFLAFSIALIVAVIMLTFQHACTFTAEVIVILFIYWGGYTGLVYSTNTAITSILESKTQSFSTGLSFALAAPTWLGIGFSMWFWLRLATAGEVDFTPTPGGTSYFILAHVSTDTKAASRFIVFICFIFAWNLVSYSVGFATGWFWAFVKILYHLLSDGDERPASNNPAGDDSQDSVGEREEKKETNNLNVKRHVVLPCFRV